MPWQTFRMCCQSWKTTWINDTSPCKCPWRCAPAKCWDCAGRMWTSKTAFYTSAGTSSTPRATNPRSRRLKPKAAPVTCRSPHWLSHTCNRAARAFCLAGKRRSLTALPRHLAAHRQTDRPARGDRLHLPTHDPHRPLRCDKDVKTTQLYAGHSTPDMTMRRYVHGRQKNLQIAAHALDGLYTRDK